MNELSTEDKERIKQWARDIADSIGRPDDGNETRARIEGAEYEHKYQREQQEQANIFNNNIIEQLQIRVEQDIVKIKKLQDDARDYSAWQSEYRASRAEIERLKAERTELRNQVIEEAVKHFKDYPIKWSHESIITYLNSLKTK